MRFQAVIAVLLKIQVFLDVTPCQFVNLHVSMVLYSEDFNFQSYVQNQFCRWLLYILLIFPFG